MNKVGIFFAYWSQEWDADYTYYIAKVARLGFDILEIITPPLLKLSDAKLADIRKAASDRGIDLTFTAGFGSEYDLASTDPAVRNAGIEFAKRCLATVGKLGGKVFAGIIYSCWHGILTPDVVDKRPYIERSQESVRKILPTAEDNGILYCLEAVNRFEQYMINTAQEGLDYMQGVNSPNLKLLLDSYHMNIEEDSIADSIRLAGDAIGHYHIGECNRRLPGQGKNIRWNEIFTALHDINYQRNIVMEPFVKMGGGVANDIALWRDLSGHCSEETLDAYAKASLEFVRNGLSQAGVK
jgi:D-psicose/D-tagatose/L-ribulose 3-epimerase